MSPVVGLDHIVLRCPDVEAALDWYQSVLGLAGERVSEWRARRVPFPSVRVSESVIIDLFSGAGGPGGSAVNLDHFCLVLEASGWDSLVASGAITVERGPTEVFGALGTGVSVYTRDPAGNVVELRKY